MSAQPTYLTDSLYAYLLKVSLRESSVLQQLRSETSKLPSAIMQISPDQGQFMALLVELIGARKTIELGVFTGYSTLAVAAALPQDGYILACDISTEWTTMAQTYWQKAGVSHKIDLQIAPAQQTLQKAIDAGKSGQFDFAFIDADKESYALYYEQCLQLIRPGGLIAFDNVLWSGKVADQNNQDKSTVIIRELNQKLHKDNRVSISLVPIADGLLLARKKQI
jgi:predicted O-methyltransferase YrrM